jgi:TonB family protein
MKLDFVNYKISHIAAFSAAFILHAGIAITSMLPSDPVVINKQAIQVSFVAPSANNYKNENNTHKKISVNFETENALYKKKNEKEQVEKTANEKSLAGKQTSGRVDEKSLATRAAESEPVFDADYLNNPAPYYPQAARKGGIQGKVFLNVLVKADGTPSTVEISRSSGSKILDVAALDAVKQWRFIPAKRSGQVVAANVIVPVEFKII